MKMEKGTKRERKKEREREIFWVGIEVRKPVWHDRQC
jgi:hypothetical protein